MSIVANPQPHHFGTADMFAPSGAATSHAELPPVLAQPHLGVPFPVYQHRHSSPYPMSFSALGPSDVAGMMHDPPVKPLYSTRPPPAPKTDIAHLPLVSSPVELPHGRSEYDFALRNADVNLHAHAHAHGPSSSPTRPKLYPQAMVKLAPPADEYYVPQVREVRLEEDELPRRVPVASVVIDGDADVALGIADQASVARSRSDGARKSQARRSMGPPPKPKRASTAYPGQLPMAPSSARMEPSRSADSRARLRAGMPPRSQTFSQNAHYPASAPGSLSRGGLVDVGSRSGTGKPTRTLPLSPPADAEPDYGGPDGLEAKVVLLGSQGVGKTSLILRYTTRSFTSDAAPATIGSSLHTRKLVHAGVRVKLQIWDTAGQERFRSMAPIYYRGAHVCVLVYDISDRQSFEDVRSWLEELGRTVPKETAIYVVGAKTDLAASNGRVVSFEEARRNVRMWASPVVMPKPDMLPPPPKSLFRSSSVSSGNDAPATTPTRSYSQGALAVFENATRSLPVSAAPTPSRHPSVKSTTPTSILASTRNSSSRPVPALKITATSPSTRGVHFPTLQSPTRTTSATNTEHVQPSITPASPASRHGVSGGRFSISGVLGMSRSDSMSGAVLNLSRLAEDNPADPARRSGVTGTSAPPTRVRTESSPMLGAQIQASGRRRSEEWSSRSWRMGKGPSAAEALGEFGASVRRRESEELLSRTSSSHGSSVLHVHGHGHGHGHVHGHGHGHGYGHGSQSQSLGAAAGSVTAQNVHAGVGSGSSAGSGSAGGGVSHSKKGVAPQGRSRGGSLGRDARLHNSAVSDGETDEPWGLDVGGIRLGECSALTGDGVEALFKSISSLLVQKKDKIERERTLRRKGSVMLTDPSAGTDAAAGKSKAGCCV